MFDEDRERPVTGGEGERAPAVLIYAPGLGRYPTNTAAGVADVIAVTLSRRRTGDFHSAPSSQTAPRGLRLGRTITDPAGRPVCEVFELDYRDHLLNLDTPTRPAGPVSPLHAIRYSVMSIFLLTAAWRRPEKARSAKAQLWMGLGLTIMLLTVGLVAIVAALAAMGLLRWIPVNWLDWVNASKVAVGAGGISLLAWAKVRSAMLHMTEQVQACIRYLNDDRHRQTVTDTLHDAIDGLIDAGWAVPIHVLGYSFGSLVVVDALFGRAWATKLPDRLASAVHTLTTIGCPADTIRLYFPDHFSGHIAEIGLWPWTRAWTNVYIPADIFGSNFLSGNDKDPHLPDAKETRPPKAPAVTSARKLGLGRRSVPAKKAPIGGVNPRSVNYTNQQLSFLTVLTMTGFRTHGGYWGPPDEGSCFDHLVDAWIPDTDHGGPATAPPGPSPTAIIPSTPPPPC